MPVQNAEIAEMFDQAGERHDEGRNVGGAVVGAMIMGVMNNGMSILGVGIDYQQVIKGLVLLGAVCIDVYNQRR
jgi:ABC-type xylose transport system permease subunit